jgi:predicted DsbA family dithiol-disulfide isomerase
LTRFVKVDIYSDIACPWCYIGKTRFERALAAFPGAADVSVSYRPFQLDPSTPERSVPLYEHYDRKFGPEFRSRHEQVIALARAEGLDFRFDRALAVNTFTAHRLLWLAGTEYGRDTQAALKSALLAAYFTEGGDVGDRDTLVRLAESVGMDAGRAGDFLASDAGSDAVRTEFAQARALGVTAVPTFVFDDKYAVQGAQDTATFRQVLEQVAAESQDRPDAAASPAGTCDDGSCPV